MELNFAEYSISWRSLKASPGINHMTSYRIIKSGSWSGIVSYTIFIEQWIAERVCYSKYMIFFIILEWNLHNSEAVAKRCSAKNVLWEISQNSRGNTCARVSFLIKLACNFIKKETLAQLFSCKFCEFSNITFSTEHLRTTASERSGFGAKRLRAKLVFKMGLFASFFLFTFLFFLFLSGC